MLNVYFVTKAMRRRRWAYGSASSKSVGYWYNPPLATLNITSRTSWGRPPLYPCVECVGRERVKEDQQGKKQNAAHFSKKTQRLFSFPKGRKRRVKRQTRRRKRCCLCGGPVTAGWRELPTRRCKRLCLCGGPVTAGRTAKEQVLKKDGSETAHFTRPQQPQKTLQHWKGEMLANIFLGPKSVQKGECEI